MKSLLLFPALLFALVVVSSCSFYPDDYEINSEQLVDITKYDVNADFSSFRTFAIADSVSLIKDGDSTRLSTPEARQIIDRIVKNMQDRGYARVGRTEEPHLGINVAAIEVTSVYYYPGWYWDYYAYYDPWYWGYPEYNYWYPYYPPVVNYYASGTLVIDLLDLKNAPAHNNKLYLIWTAYIRGLMNGTHTSQQILENIDQCFIQTPVLRTN